jgi:hypothetical protein
MRHLPFLGNDHETNNGTKLGAKQQILNNATVGLQQWKSCVFCVARAEVISETRFRA